MICFTHEKDLIASCRKHDSVTSVTLECRYGRQTASALHYCHRCNVLHLDVKPSNILVHNGECKLADFGSSAVRGSKPRVSERLTDNLILCLFMQPETEGQGRKDTLYFGVFNSLPDSESSSMLRTN